MFFIQRTVLPAWDNDHLRTVEHVRGLLVEDDGLPVDVPGQDGVGDGQEKEGPEVADHGEEVQVLM